MKESIPCPHSVSVKKTEFEEGYQALQSEQNLNIDGFDIYLPSNKNSKISLSSVDTFMHETFHYFSQMTSPKETRRLAKLIETGDLERFDNMYYACLYNDFPFSESVISETLDKFLARLSIEQKVDFLQICRYRVKNESAAFAEGSKYAALLKKLCAGKNQEPIRVVNGAAFNFDMKLKLLNEKLAEIIKEYRSAKSLN